MAAFTDPITRAVAFAGAFALMAPPALAAPLGMPAQGHAPVPVLQGWSVEQETAQRHRGWGGRDDYGSWGRHRHYRRGPSTGDVLAGVLIIGGIAAIAAAASKQNRDRDDRPRTYPDDPRAPDYRDRNAPYRGASPARPSYAGGGLDRAADMCVREVERDERVDEVQNVARGPGGWRVEGDLRNGRNFRCMLDNDGRITAVDLDAAPHAGAAADGQWDDDAYARARGGLPPDGY